MNTRETHPSDLKVGDRIMRADGTHACTVVEAPRFGSALIAVKVQWHDDGNRRIPSYRYWPQSTVATLAVEVAAGEVVPHG